LGAVGVTLLNVISSSFLRLRECLFAIMALPHVCRIYQRRLFELVDASRDFLKGEFLQMLAVLYPPQDHGHGH
jgi:hypothetical protein